MHWSYACIDYHKELTIKNLDALPAGLNCRWLIVIPSPYANEFVAKRWARKPPTLKSGEQVIRF